MPKSFFAVSRGLGKSPICDLLTRVSTSWVTYRLKSNAGCLPSIGRIKRGAPRNARWYCFHYSLRPLTWNQGPNSNGLYSPSGSISKATAPPNVVKIRTSEVTEAIMLRKILI